MAGGALSVVLYRQQRATSSSTAPGVSNVCPDDTAAITTYDGRSLTGQVIQVDVLEDSLLIALT